jgi:hypothetical protein
VGSTKPSLVSLKIMGKEPDPKELSGLDMESEQAINSVLDAAEAQEEEFDADQLAALGIEPEQAIKAILDEEKAEDQEANEIERDYEERQD